MELVLLGAVSVNLSAVVHGDACDTAGGRVLVQVDHHGGEEAKTTDQGDGVHGAGATATAEVLSSRGSGHGVVALDDGASEHL